MTMGRRAFKGEGIKLREYLYGESDAILQIFTRDAGTMKAVARGLKRSRKRFPGSIRKLCFYEFHFNRGKGDHPSIGGARLIDGYEEIVREFKHYCVAEYILQVIQYFYPENVSSPFIYDSLRNFLQTLRGTKDVISPMKWMEIRILYDSGFMSSFAGCSACNSRFIDADVLLYCNVKTGQIICKACEKKGKFIVVSSDVKDSVAGAVDSTCGEYRVPAQGDIGFLNRITTSIIVEKLGFSPKALGEIFRRDGQIR